LNRPSSRSLQLVKYFDNGVLNATALGRYTFHRKYFLLSRNFSKDSSTLQDRAFFHMLAYISGKSDRIRTRYLCLSLMHPFSVMSANITTTHTKRKLDSLDYIFVADSVGLATITSIWLSSKYDASSVITQNNGRYAVQDHSRSRMLVPSKGVCDVLLVNNTNSYHILCRTVSMLLLIIGQISTFDRFMPGESLNTRLRNFAQQN